MREAGGVVHRTPVRDEGIIMGLPRFLPLVAFSLAALAGCAAPPSTPADDALAIARSLAAVDAADVAAKDATAMADLFTPDGVLLNGVARFKGREAIRTFREAGFKAGIYREDVTVTDATLVGDVIYDAGEFTVYLDSAAGSRELKGRWSSTLVRSGGTWKIGMLTIAAAPPPAKP
jgi:uncharacterized protein (TIGR02246 family)